MSTEPVNSSGAANWRIDVIGGELQPVIVIDNAIGAAERLVDIAAEAPAFSPQAPYYPGVRSPAPAEYASAIVRHLGPLICDTFRLTTGSLVIEDAQFSLVTTPPPFLAPYQRLPHFDGTGEGIIAILHYLCDERHGGTAFYSHRSTGFESLSDERLPIYTERLRAELARDGLPSPAYPKASSALFDSIGAFACRFNRVLIYRGRTLHSGLIPEDHTLADCPRRGRLTVNTFLNGAPA